MAKLIAVVMHVPGIPEREESLERLQAKLEGVPVVVSNDEKRLGSLNTAISGVLEALKHDPEYITVIPDDCIPCNHFAAVMEDVLRAKPTEALCLYNNAPGSPVALSLGVNWTSRISGMVQICAPAELWREFIDWVKECKQNEIAGAPEDSAFEVFLNTTERMFYTPVFSILQHGDCKSLSGNDSGPCRKAVIGPLEDMRIVNWDTDAAYCTHEQSSPAAMIRMSTHAQRSKYNIHKAYYNVLEQRPFKPAVFVPDPRLGK